jgi:hypothetical protein
MVDGEGGDIRAGWSPTVDHKMNDEGRVENV